MSEHTVSDIDAHRAQAYATTLAANPKPGFAQAVQPVASTLIVTDSHGLTVGDVMIQTRDRAIPAYRAMPKGDGPYPVVIVVQEIFGVHEHIEDVARRFAKLGYMAIAPELYVRQGDVSRLNSIDEIRKIVAQVPDEQVLADLDASVDWARSNGGDTARLGLTGFCWGGRIAWLYAAHQPQLKAAVAWYGRLAGDASTLQPSHPIDLANCLNAPVLGLYGGQDQGIPLTSVASMQKKLRQAGSRSTIQVYPEAPHAFFADYRPSYRKAAAEEGWEQLLAWFKKHGL